MLNPQWILYLILQLQADGADVGNAVEDNDTDDDVDEDECDLEDFYYAGEDVDAEKVLDRFKFSQLALIVFNSLAFMTVFAQC